MLGIGEYGSAYNKLETKEVSWPRRARLASLLAVTAITSACLGQSAAAPLERPAHQQPQVYSDSLPAVPHLVPNHRAPIPDGERLAVAGLADPNVFKQNDNSFFLSGTEKTPEGVATRTIPIYHSADLTNFVLDQNYNPGALDPEHDYCNVWAPDITEAPSGGYRMFFTAKQTEEGQDCDNSNHEQAIFYAVSPNANMQFGPPQPLVTQANIPRNAPGYCPTDGCKEMRIDPEVVNADGHEWLFYTWYGLGQNVVSVMDLNNPADHHTVSKPAPSDNTINEAPDVFQRNGKYYMLYSRDWYNKNYGLRYIVSDNIVDLTRGNQSPRILSQAKLAPSGLSIENTGGSSVVQRDGRYYIFYHKGTFDQQGEMTDRSTYMQPLHFQGDAIEEIK